MLVPGASVTRGGQTEALRQHSPVRVSDTVKTDATGRVRILFNDDSTVDMGANSSLDMRDFADVGEKSVFNAHLLQGVPRVVTGKIVEQNPKGFAVTTPEGNIGIRGTIISVRTGNGVTTVYVENTTREVYVNNINVPGGQKITIPSDPVRPEPIQPQDRRNLGRDLAFRGGTGVAAAAPEPIQAGSRPEEQLRGTTHLTAKADLIPPDSPLTDVSLGTQSLGDSLTMSNSMAGTAFVKGSLMTSYPYSPVWGSGTTGFSDFFFEVNLGSGSVSNAEMHARADDGTLINTYDVAGGNGIISGGTGTISGFSGQAISDVGGSPSIATILPAHGTFMNVTSANLGSVGGAVSGSYGVNGPPSWVTIDYGSFSGNRVP
jgi:hypothetical protein